MDFIACLSRINKHIQNFQIEIKQLYVSFQGKELICNGRLTKNTVARVNRYFIPSSRKTNPTTKPVKTAVLHTPELKTCANDRGMSPCTILISKCKGKALP